MTQTVQPFDYSVDILRALLWQYNQAPRLESLVTQKDAYYKRAVSGFWSDWFRDVFDFRTANAFGLQVWARILGIKLTLSSSPTNPAKPTLGFSALNQNFGHGNFSQASSGSLGLTLEQKRLVIRLRYFQLISRCTVPEINRFMAAAFAGYGRVYVQQTLTMGPMVYVFDFSPDSQLSLVLQQFDLLPRPATVGISFTVTSRPTFGFGPANENFGNGNFINHEI